MHNAKVSLGSLKFTLATHRTPPPLHPRHSPSHSSSSAGLKTNSPSPLSPAACRNPSSFGISGGEQSSTTFLSSPRSLWRVMRGTAFFSSSRTCGFQTGGVRTRFRFGQGAFGGQGEDRIVQFGRCQFVSQFNQLCENAHQSVSVFLVLIRNIARQVLISISTGRRVVCVRAKLV